MDFPDLSQWNNCLETCLCVCLCFIYTFTSTEWTRWGSEDILDDPHDFKRPFEGKDVVLRLRLELGLGLG